MNIRISLLAGVGGYALWYYLKVGKFCPAMWYGTAPPVIIGLIAVTVYRFLKRFRPESDL